MPEAQEGPASGPAGTKWSPAGHILHVGGGAKSRL